MINTLIGQKTDQTQSFLQDGRRIPVTEILVPENVVLQVKTPDKDKYSAVQIGVGSRKKPNKSFLGHAKKANLEKAPLKIKEVSLKEFDEVPALGESLAVDAVFKPGDIMQVTGISKGKGFAGVVRRHNFRGGPKTHGQSDRHRAPGSIGQSTTPGRVYRGKRMAGRMGSDTVTIKNLTVVDIDSENKKLYVLGLVPGNKGSWVYLTKTGERKKFTPLLSTEEEKEDVASDAKVETQEVETEAQTVVTPEEVKTVEATVEQPAETVETPAEGTKASEEIKESEAVPGESKEENAS